VVHFPAEAGIAAHWIIDCARPTPWRRSRRIRHLHGDHLASLRRSGRHSGCRSRPARPRRARRCCAIDPGVVARLRAVSRPVLGSRAPDTGRRSILPGSGRRSRSAVEAPCICAGRSCRGGRSQATPTRRPCCRCRAARAEARHGSCRPRSARSPADWSRDRCGRPSRIRAQRAPDRIIGRARHHA